MKTLFTVAALAALTLALAVSAGHAHGCNDWMCGTNGTALNGIWENGIWENGTDYQGMNMQGTRLHGRPGKVTISSTSLVRVELRR
jgi:hypothetical protein